MVLGAPRPKPRQLPAIQHFVLRNDSQVVTVRVEEIDVIHGGAGRLRIIQGPTVYFAHGRLSDVAPRLDQRFVRISRSAMVNAASVRRYATEGNEEIVLYLRSNRRVVVTRSYARGAVRALKDLLPGLESLS